MSNQPCQCQSLNAAGSRTGTKLIASDGARWVSLYQCTTCGRFWERFDHERKASEWKETSLSDVHKDYGDPKSKVSKNQWIRWF